jgi:hypothetical protein
MKVLIRFCHVVLVGVDYSEMSDAEVYFTSHLSILTYSTGTHNPCLNSYSEPISQTTSHPSTHHCVLLKFTFSLSSDPFNHTPKKIRIITKLAPPHPRRTLLPGITGPAPTVILQPPNSVLMLAPNVIAFQFLPRLVTKPRAFRYPPMDLIRAGILFSEILISFPIILSLLLILLLLLPSHALWDIVDLGYLV